MSSLASPNRCLQHGMAWKHHGIGQYLPPLVHTLERDPSRSPPCRLYPAQARMAYHLAPTHQQHPHRIRRSPCLGRHRMPIPPRQAVGRRPIQGIKKAPMIPFIPRSMARTLQLLQTHQGAPLRRWTIRSCFLTPILPVALVRWRPRQAGIEIESDSGIYARMIARLI
jgi:hypothetical protein